MFALPSIIATALSFVYYILTTGLRGYLLKILVAIGITYTTYSNVTELVTLLKSKYSEAFLGLDTLGIQILTEAGFPEAATIIFSCITTRLLVSAAGHFDMSGGSS